MEDLGSSAWKEGRVGPGWNRHVMEALAALSQSSNLRAKKG